MTFLSPRKHIFGARMLAVGLVAALLSPAAQAHVSIGISVPLGYVGAPVYYSPPPPNYYATPPMGYSTTTTDAYGNTVIVTQPTPGVVVTQPSTIVVPSYSYGPYPGYGYGVVNPAFIGGYILGRHR